MNIAYWVMYYSKPVFKEFDLSVPTSFADLTDIADKLVAAGKVPFHQMNIIFEFVWFQALLMGYAPDVYDKLSKGEAKYTDEAVVTVANKWSEMIGKKYYIDPGSTTDPQTLLKTGEVAMIYMGTFFTGQLNSLNLVSGTDYGVFLFPNMNPDVARPQMALETGPLLVGKGSEHETAALDYSSWWMGTDAQEAWAKSRATSRSTPRCRAMTPRWRRSSRTSPTRRWTSRCTRATWRRRPTRSTRSPPRCSASSSPTAATRCPGCRRSRRRPTRTGLRTDGRSPGPRGPGDHHRPAGNDGRGGPRP
nr:extracellular solute-binding protein [Tessaracoccus coleopterorum]